MVPRARRIKGRGRANRGAGYHQADNNQVAHQQYCVAGDQRLTASSTADRGQLEGLPS